VQKYSATSPPTMRSAAPIAVAMASHTVLADGTTLRVRR
jgi:hypothetical protein